MEKSLFAAEVSSAHHVSFAVWMAVMVVVGKNMIGL